MKVKSSKQNNAQIVKMMLNERIAAAMAHAKLTPAMLVAKTGATKGAVSQWLNGTVKNLKSETALSISLATGVNPAWLITGTGEMLAFKYSPMPTIAPLAAAEPNAPYANTEALPNLGKVPLIDWVAAGDFCGSSDPYPVGMAEDWLYCPSRHGSKTYALRVRGESMFNPSGTPSFKDGDIIFIDPDRAANHKSLVICRLDDAKETTFKRLLIEGDTKMLEALNPSWPERIIKVNGNATICGVIIGRYDVF